jgi:chromate transporter
MREDSTFSLYMSLLAVFVPFSLVAIGGGGSVFAPIQRESVDVQNWITGREFIELFAIARVSPGPGSMLATVIGWKVAGWGGALVATIAMFLPSSILCLGVAQVWNRYRGRDWHKALETGLAPIGTGLMFAGVVAILKIGHGGPFAWALAGVAAGTLTWRPKTHPFAVLLIGAVAFNIQLLLAH